MHTLTVREIAQKLNVTDAAVRVWIKLLISGQVAWLVPFRN